MIGLGLGAGVLLLAWLPAAPASALLRLLSLEEIARRSQHILCGEVVELKCYRGPFLDLGELLFTDVTVKITEQIAGKIEEETVTVQVPGGRIGDQFMVCPDAPVYEKGEKVLLFLCTYNQKLWNTGWAQGKYRLKAPPPSSSEGFSVEGVRDFPIRDLRLLSDLRQDVLKIKAVEGGK
ncbi:MAG: hypothetical protein HY717_16220 [Planctomycetes bacterium]|nr:hypothetical protein [Planctomycetota bacterium]